MNEYLVSLLKEYWSSPATAPIQITIPVEYIHRILKELQKLESFYSSKCNSDELSNEYINCIHDYCILCRIIKKIENLISSPTHLYVLNVDSEEYKFLLPLINQLFGQASTPDVSGK
ncbi:hypothetical protein [Anaerotignum sp.]|uniref:hypothetical protein n=1 Tax=Anaerotignum sp. TaxID=2039241 RepID=UPI00289913D5|nr:hypothetical protein [Anaerotignum sp.]